MNARQIRVCVVLPAYNEGAVISDVIRSLYAALESKNYQAEVVVVDDGSRDYTVARAEKAGAQVIRHIVNTGTGGATATGLTYAQQCGFDLAATVDADGQHHPEDLMRGLDLLGERQCDLLIGSRLMDASGMSDVKILGNRGISLVTYLLFGVKVTDSQSGLRVFSRKALELLRWKTSGYEFCSEMLWRAKQQGLAIEEYPIRAIYTEYSKGKGQNNWNGLNIVTTLARRRLLELLNE